MRKFLKWIGILVLSILILLFVLLNRLGIPPFSQRLAEPNKVHVAVQEFLGGNNEQELPPDLRLKLSSAINELEDTRSEYEGLFGYSLMLTELYMFSGNDLLFKLAPRKAANHLFKALANARDLASWYPLKQQTIGNIYNLLHLAYVRSGDLQSAKEYVLKAIQEFEAVGATPYVAMGRINLAKLYSELGEYHVAIGIAQQAIDQYAGVKMTHQDSLFFLSGYRRIAEDHALLAKLSLEMGDRDSMLFYRQKAVTAGKLIYESSNWFRAEEKKLQRPLLLQSIALAWGETPLEEEHELIGKMLSENESNLRELATTDHNVYLGAHKLLQAEWLLYEGDVASAKRKVAEGVEHFGMRLEDNWQLSERVLDITNVSALYIYSRILPDLLANEAELILPAQMSIVHAMDQSGSWLRDDFRHMYNAVHFRKIYQEALHTAYNSWVKSGKHIDEINYLAESQRNQLLQKSIQRELLLEKAEGAFKIWLEKDEVYRQDLQGLQKQMMKATSIESYEELSEQAVDLLNERGNFYAETFKKGGDAEAYAKIAVTAQIPEIRDLQKCINANQVLLQFVPYQQSMLVIGVTREQVLIKKTPAVKHWEEDLQKYQRCFEKDLGEETFTKAAFGVYTACVADVLADLPARTNAVTFIPGGALRGVNLGLLLSTADVKKYKDMKYFFKSHLLSYDYLLSSFSQHQSTSYSSQNSVLVCTALYEQGSTCDNGVPLDSLSELGLKLAAQKQVENIPAARKSLKKAMKDGQSVFITAHGIIDPSDPWQSHLLLTEETCQLSIAEMIDWDMNGTDLILGSCQTEAGENIPGNGILSIAQAVSIAGARSLVASTGNLKDEMTAQLLRHYFIYLDKGFTKAAALQEAQLAYLGEASDRFTPPFNWGKLIIIGHSGQAHW